MKFLSEIWCGLEWTPWVHFRDHEGCRSIPKAPGVYRVRQVDQNRLFYVGQTGRTVRQRVCNELISQTLAEEMPYNDPHTAAPSLWVWRNAENIEFAVSTANVALPTNEREGLECYLLWQYRLEYGESTVCNHGRFHPSYKKSKARKSGQWGYRLDDGQANPAGGHSLPALDFHGMPYDNDWMGLTWSEWKELTADKIRDVPLSWGLYRIMGDAKLLYIGESFTLRQRLHSHSKKLWGQLPVLFSYYELKPDPLGHNLKELENDLIGAFFSLTKTVPKFQFSNNKG